MESHFSSLTLNSRTVERSLQYFEANLLSSMRLSYSCIDTWCFSLGLECPPKTDTVKVWIPACGLLGGDRTFKGRGVLVGGNWVTGGMPHMGLWHPAPSLSFRLPAAMSERPAPPHAHRHDMLPQAQRRWGQVTIDQNPKPGAKINISSLRVYLSQVFVAVTES